MKKILVSTDFSSNSKAGLRFAAQLSAQTGASIVFYHAIEVMKPTSWSDAKYKKFAEEKNNEFGAKLVKFVREAIKDIQAETTGFTYITEIGTEVRQMLIKNGKKFGVDMICMSTKGAGNVKRLFGTHASSMIMHSPIPLAIIPNNYKPQNIDHLFYASDLAAITPEMRIVKNLAAEFDATVAVYHYDYLLHVSENRTKLEQKIAKHRAPGITFNFKRQEIDISLADHLHKDIIKEKPSAVVLFTKQNRNWFDRLFSRSESAAMAFHSETPLIVYRKKI